MGTRRAVSSSAADARPGLWVMVSPTPPACGRGLQSPWYETRDVSRTASFSGGGASGGGRPRSSGSRHQDHMPVFPSLKLAEDASGVRGSDGGCGCWNIVPSLARLVYLVNRSLIVVLAICLLWMTSLSVSANSSIQPYLTTLLSNRTILPLLFYP